MSIHSFIMCFNYFRYTYSNGQTIVYHAKWVPCADGRVKVVESTDPGLQNFEIYGQELVCTHYILYLLKMKFVLQFNFSASGGLMRK